MAPHLLSRQHLVSLQTSPPALTVVRTTFGRLMMQSSAHLRRSLFPRMVGLLQWASARSGNDCFLGQVASCRLVGLKWQALLGARLNGDADDDNFGHSVSLSDDGSVVAVGAPPGGTDIGGCVFILASMAMHGTVSVRLWLKRICSTDLECRFRCMAVEARSLLLMPTTRTAVRLVQVQAVPESARQQVPNGRSANLHWCDGSAS